MGLGRFELPTSPLSGVRSNQLSYRPVIVAESVQYINTEPVRSQCRPSSVFIPRVSRTRLNMQSGYAALDRRDGFQRSRDGLIQALSRPKTEEVHDNVPNTLQPSLARRSPRSRKHSSVMTFSLRKEVIQPQVLLRLPCYDFTPIMNHTLDGCPLAVGSPASSATHFRDVTGGVYKARERIHRGVLIRDY